MTLTFSGRDDTEIIFRAVKGMVEAAVIFVVIFLVTTKVVNW